VSNNSLFFYSKHHCQEHIHHYTKYMYWNLNLHNLQFHYNIDYLSIFNYHDIKDWKFIQKYYLFQHSLKDNTIKLKYLTSRQGLHLKISYHSIHLITNHHNDFLKLSTNQFLIQSKGYNKTFVFHLHQHYISN